MHCLRATLPSVQAMVRGKTKSISALVASINCWRIQPDQVRDWVAQ